MIEKGNNQPDVNFIPTSAGVFVEYYNSSIPDVFPHATVKTLEKFKTAHPALFKRNGDWTIDKHRKKLMDWLTSHKEE